ncbi:lysM and putative peptidoglycan-binding domain-containing protein 1-like isoform X2 [Ostrea edulis]|uniref:lysM and putative peptidoglycan-binding domain-containing protein 1-like isoform X2 n=1 Tax=Ostrea edulis TaxID=37623 RepID=UPI0024AEE8F7|nr:lysM and putative peptidoglycan-binding domain-containing protein 1-like isoform X2 [Ostrea edulis]XP_048750139.2 lysM and putative peptidoglycan-binding domain-containing protein 1-like isoform X2 [Ostrea edulis]XP_056003011.1 lysM and putative peptidoglycan-binding domain-containing protein 1-like isoform X2 [Ostrea edulis]
MSKMADGNGKESQLLGKFVEKQTKYGTATRLVAKSPLLVKHRVCPSDTLMGIALKYGSTVEKIKRENKLWTNDSLFLREHLLIPITSENAKEIPKDSEIIESDNTSKSPSTNAGNRSRSNSQISESEHTDSIDTAQNKAEETKRATEQDFLSKFDHSFAVLKSNVKKMEQNTSHTEQSLTHCLQVSNKYDLNLVSPDTEC